MMMLPARRAWWGNSMGDNVFSRGMGDNSFPLAGMGALSVGVNKSIYYVGEVPTYVIQNAAPNAQVAWSSTKNGLATGENQTAYAGQVTDANGALVGAGSPWTAADVGTWTKTATVNGENYTTTFQVLPLGATTGSGSSGSYIPYYGPVGTSQRAQAPAPADNINIFGYDVPRIPFYIVLAALAFYLVKGKR